MNDKPNYPSIFNDVIGPVMRGPSSSHCAAALRIGRMLRDLMDTKIEEVFIAFDSRGSLATTHESQGSDIGIFGGFLGWETTDERLAESARAIQDVGIRVQIEIRDFEAKHPNTYKIMLKNSKEQHTATAIALCKQMPVLIILALVFWFLLCLWIGSNGESFAAGPDAIR